MHDLSDDFADYRLASVTAGTAIIAAPSMAKGYTHEVPPPNPLHHHHAQHGELVPDGGWLLIVMAACVLLVVVRDKLVEVYYRARRSFKSAGPTF
jgi:hypothetical protein